MEVFRKNLVLFLDIDGVLNSEQSAVYYNRLGHGNGGLNDSFCPIALSNFHSLLEEFPNLRIVVSSTWRLGETIDSMREVLWKIGKIPKERVIGLTPCKRGGPRGLEIQEWLDQNPVDCFVIVDDDSDMAHLKPSLIQTSWRHGFMRKDMVAVMNHFYHPWRTAAGIDITRMKDAGEVDFEIIRVQDGNTYRYWGLAADAPDREEDLEKWAKGVSVYTGEEYFGAFVKETKDLQAPKS